MNLSQGTIRNTLSKSPHRPPTFSPKRPQHRIRIHTIRIPHSSLENQSENAATTTSPGDDNLTLESTPSTSTVQTTPTPKRKQRQSDSTDWIASALTRRFGIAGGLAWLGFLSFGVISEQIKTRLEIASEEAGTQDVTDQTEITTPEGLSYVDLRVGGGAAPQKGFLIVLDYKASANGQVFEDTKARGKPIVFLYGARPFTGGVCPGVEIALRSMKSGGKRRVTIPPELGFKDGAVLRPTEHVPDKQGVIPAGATLVYELELQRVSIPPS